MQQYERFIFHSYSYDAATHVIELRYGFDEAISFTERLELPADGLVAYDPAELDRALFLLHLIGGISYYKAVCPETIEIRSGSLNANQAEFWRTVYLKGLGEFSYENQLDLRDRLHFPISGEAVAPTNMAIPTAEPSRVLSLFGGGKDSMATMEILKAAGIDYTVMRVGAHPIIDDLFSLLGQPHLQVARRLDPQIMELNKQGAYNGHIPITGYIASLNVVLSLLYGYDAVVVSNERSSSYGNVEYLGEEINHQWSKGAEFEALFRSYVAQYVTTKVQYVNLLGSLSELSITKLVATHPEYLHHITSCNVNWRLVADERPDTAKVGLWCGHCPKCLFTFALLAAWLPLDEVISIFGQNLFTLPENEKLYRELFGLEGFKPFECVGTPEEMVAAFTLANRHQSLDDTLIGAIFRREVGPNYPNAELVTTEALTPQPSPAVQPPYVADWLSKVELSS